MVSVWCSATDRAAVQTEVLEWIERYLQIEHILDLDSAEWKPPFTTLRKLQRIEDAEELARELRSKWMLGTDPIPNMTELLEEKGLKVLIVDLPEAVGFRSWRTGPSLRPPSLRLREILCIGGASRGSRLIQAAEPLPLPRTWQPTPPLSSSAPAWDYPFVPIARLKV